jgi:hypothetical protein
MEISWAEGEASDSVPSLLVSIFFAHASTAPSTFAEGSSERSIPLSLFRLPTSRCSLEISPPPALASTFLVKALSPSTLGVLDVLGVLAEGFRISPSTDSASHVADAAGDDGLPAGISA